MSGLKAIHIYFAFMAILGAANFGDSQASTFCTDNGNHPHPFGDPDNWLVYAYLNSTSLIKK